MAKGYILSLTREDARGIVVAATASIPEVRATSDYFNDAAPAPRVRILSLKELAVVTGFPREIPEQMTNGECEALRNEVRCHHSERVILEYQRDPARPTQTRGERFFYVIRISGNHFKTGIASDVEKRLRNYRSSNSNAVVVDTWPCPSDVTQEKDAQRKMCSHPSCTWAGGETFTVHDEKAFVAELRRLFGEPSLTQPQPVQQAAQRRRPSWFVSLLFGAGVAYAKLKRITRKVLPASSLPRT